MENRILYQKLNEYANCKHSSLHANLEIQNLIKSLATSLCKEMNKKGTDSLEVNHTFDNFEKCVKIAFVKSEIEQLNIRIDLHKISYGFSQFYTNKDILLDVDSQFNSIRKRYFDELVITEIGEDQFMLKGEFSTTAKQLNSRDFMSYSLFLLEKASQISNAIKEKNKVFQIRLAV